MEATLSSDLESASEWLTKNILFLHLAKTESILFGSKRKLYKCDKFNVICSGNIIESKSNVTYLSVTLDQFLSGDIIVSKILTKSSNKLKLLYKNARNINLKTKQKHLISALIQMSI